MTDEEKTKIMLLIDKYADKYCLGVICQREGDVETKYHAEWVSLRGEICEIIEKA